MKGTHSVPKNYSLLNRSSNKITESNASQLSLPFLSAKKLPQAGKLTMKKNANPCTNSGKQLTKVDSSLKGFTSHNLSYLKEAVVSPAEKKGILKKHFEFYTAPKGSMRHLVKDHNASSLNQSSGIKSVISRFQGVYNTSQIGSVDTVIQSETKRDRPVKLPPLKKKLATAPHRKLEKKDTEMEEMYYQLLANWQETSKDETPENGVFGADKYLRHPLKDGLKLMLIGEDLNKETQNLDSIHLFSDVVQNESTGSRAPPNFFIQKNFQMGSHTLLQTTILLTWSSK